MSASLLQMQDADLGLIFAGTHAFNDLKFYLWRSPDEGKSWHGVKNLVEHPDRNYHDTSIRFVADRVVLLYLENDSRKLKAVPAQ